MEVCFFIGLKSYWKDWSCKSIYEECRFIWNDESYDKDFETLM